MPCIRQQQVRKLNPGAETTQARQGLAKDAQVVVRMADDNFVTCEAADPGGQQQAGSCVCRVAQLIQQRPLEEHLELSQPAAAAHTTRFKSLV